MYPFQDLVPFAKAGRLAHLPQLEALLTAPDPAQLLAPGSAQALPLELAVLQYMLERFPVHPEEADRMVKSLDSGVLRLNFFEVSNPVPVVYVVPGHPGIELVKRALAHNLSSARYRAACALHRWRSRPKQWARVRAEQAMLTRYRNALPWPTPEAFRQNRSAALLVQQACVDQLHAFERQLRQNRQARLQKIRVLAGLDVSWHQLLEDLALHVTSVLPVRVPEPA